MIASGGLDFDDIVYNRSSSSEDDYNNRGKFSSRSDTSNWSSDSSSSVPAEPKMAQINDPSYAQNEALNASSIKQKKMVMSEIRRKVFSSDSERENEIFNDLDGMQYGKTPPREVRRSKQKYKCVKFSNSTTQFSVKKSEKKHLKSQPSSNSGTFTYKWQKQREEERKEKQLELIETQTQEPVSDAAQRSTKLVRVNSSKSLKSITQQRTFHNSRHDEYQSSNKFMNYAVRLATVTRKLDVKKSSSRLHFYKSFSLLVNLGGRIPNQQHRSFDVLRDEEADNFQVGYYEFLWLQLQAHHAARTVEEQDNYLEEERREIDDVLDQIINYQFSFKKGSCPDMSAMLEKQESIEKEKFHKNSDSDSNEDEFLCFGTSFDDSMATSTPTRVHKEEPILLVFEEKNKEENSKLVEEKPVQTLANEMKKVDLDIEREEEKTFGSSKQHKIAAMHEITALLQKVENVEALYPNTKALTIAHPKYKEIKFVRNMEAMVLWLNLNKDLYHRLNNLADWIDIDPDDLINWKDWFDCGLDMHCIKTRKTYQTSHNVATAESLESSANLPTLLSNIALRRSKRDKRKRISQNRFSVVEKTTTSRYRLFVERRIKENGLIQIIQKSREILHFPLMKAKFCLSEPAVVKSARVIKRQGNIDSYNSFYELYPTTLLKIFARLDDGRRFMDALSSMEKEVEACRKFSHFSKSFHDMNLPSFVDIYSFLIMVPFDLVHECIRFRLDYNPKVEPSHHSIRQLILECKDVVSGGILCRHYLKEMLDVIPDDKIPFNQVSIKQRKEEFDDDLKAILNIYFDYLQSWFRMMQESTQASESMKNIMEEEWHFAKEICPYIKGAEARAGFKYCCQSSGLLKSTEQFLETSVDDCCSKCNSTEEDNIQRHQMLSACREYKDIFKEVRGRASKALTFAKMLQKDLGIANKYTLNCSTEDLFKVLKDTKHFKVDYHGISTGFWIFVSEQCAKKENFSTKLLNLTFGMDAPDDSNYYGDGYVLLVPKNRKDKCLWLGRRINVEYTNEVKLALSYIEQVNSITIICNNLYHLNTQCKSFERKMNTLVTLNVERTSSHNVIEKALVDLKESTNKLAKVLVAAVEHVYENLYLNESADLDEADRNATHKSCIETMHSCYAVGFEYLRELVRMYHGSNNTGISEYFVKFSRMWMQFVTTKIEKGRGTKPRWAVPGLEFLVATIEPNNTESMREEEFSALQKDMQYCVSHIIGKAESRTKRKLKAEKRSSSPFTVHRSRSVPSQKKDNQSFDSLGLPPLDGPIKNSFNSLPGDFDCETRGGSMVDIASDNTLNGTACSSEGDTVDSIQSDSTLDTDVDLKNDPPAIRVRNAINLLDERRLAKLQHMRVIGSVTYKKPNFASELVHNVRRVNFKWQLGNKIGEGQFGKVYSSVNLDTGDLMAVKQVRFNPHDYGTIQEIADEITNIQGIQHDSLVQYFGVELHKDEMLIFMEYCADGTIAEVAKLGLPESMIRVYTYQITRAINFLHQAGVVHRDVKGANIFLSSSGLIKIGDFGSAVKLKDAMCTSQGEVFNTRGTAAFMAPEVITLDKGRGYGRAADIWSLGCVVIEMTTGKQPWYECDNIYAIMYRVGDGNHPPIPDWLSEEGRDFLECCFIHDQNYRWTAHMLEDHAFVKCC